jgi:hypothetical protein
MTQLLILFRESCFVCNSHTSLYTHSLVSWAVTFISTHNTLQVLFSGAGQSRTRAAAAAQTIQTSVIWWIFGHLRIHYLLQVLYRRNRRKMGSHSSGDWEKSRNCKNIRCLLNTNVTATVIILVICRYKKNWVITKNNSIYFLEAMAEVAQSIQLLFGIRVPVEPRIFTSPHHPDGLWYTPYLLLMGYQGLFPRGNPPPGEVKLTTCLQPVLGSRKRGSIHPLSHTSLWCSA